MPYITEILPATHNQTEWDVVPMGYIHLKKGDKVIHKKPAAFEKRTKEVIKFKKRFDEDTGMDVVEEIRKTVERPPACSIDQYKKDGWVRCNRDGTELLNWDGSPKEKPGPKPKGD